MDRVSRLVVFAALFGALYFFFGSSSSDEERTFQPIVQQELVLPEGERPPPSTCDLWSSEVHAVITTRGGALSHVYALTEKYRRGGEPVDFVTTPDHPELNPLFIGLRNPAAKQADWLARTDVQDFRITESTAKKCTLVHEDADLQLEKTFTVGASPYAVHLDVKVTNKGPAPKSYALQASTSAYLLDSAVQSQMFRMNPLMSHVECVSEGGQVDRFLPDAFEAEDFQDKNVFPITSLTAGDWAQPSGPSGLAAVSNAYFTNALAHDGGPTQPVCQVQIQERWNSAAFPNKKSDPKAAAIYRARLHYPVRSLEPSKTETYAFQAFIGPKERKALAAAGNRFEPLIDLGFFSIIAKVLVGYLLWLHDLIPSWGFAIVVLTITARTLLFPLTWPSVKNMIQMRELKPEMDKLNERFKDDAQAKGLAQMELWKKHGVNPMKGCLPQLASMPVWFALYTTLQTAVELYNIPFLWFPDLSEPDPLYLLPFIIGATYFVQQKMMPMQGGDPAQQKMMLYFMPAMFTVFMLFLPAGLGVYMFTNSILGIAQQRVVEGHAKRTLAERQARMGDSEIVQSQTRRSGAKS
jgi:YidC/Oxa1 family membrane protein insertase